MKGYALRRRKKRQGFAKRDSESLGGLNKGIRASLVTYRKFIIMSGVASKREEIVSSTMRFVQKRGDKQKQTQAGFDEELSEVALEDVIKLRWMSEGFIFEDDLSRVGRCFF